MALTGQGKLNEALNEEYCDNKWNLRVHDPCLFAKKNGSPLDGINWKSHRKSVASNVVTYTFYDDNLVSNPSANLLATAVLTYADSTLEDLTASDWTFV